MGTLRSALDWTGREIGGVILGEPVRANPGDPANGIPPSGDYIWDDSGIPGDVIDDDGDIWEEVPNAS